MSEEIDQKTDQYQQREAELRERLEQQFQHVGMSEPKWPLETGTVLQFVDKSGYRADGDFVLGLVNAGTVEVPLMGGYRKWDAVAVYCLLMQLEGRRRWKLHQNHIHKMSAVERLQLEAEAEGHDHPFTDLDKFDVETLLHLMADQETFAARHALRIAVQAKLRAGETI